METSAREAFGVDVAFILLLCNIHERLKRIAAQQEPHVAHKTESSGAMSRFLSSLSLSSKKVRVGPL